MELSKNERLILGEAYHNYLENHSTAYRFSVKSSGDSVFLNAIRGLCSEKLIRCDAFSDDARPFSLALFYDLEITQDGIYRAEMLGL